jgi:hypothetical protein
MTVKVQLIHLLATSRNVVIYKWKFKRGSELIKLFYGQLTEK